ncbi:hypothetical protein JTE90_003961 [Oedothorax gibbosus]|uniref:Uncharacterized protein n=1 Tax=Oedothorax gibbosus TaxID=931172 RepID=A0AAV6UYX1_9ARAC|nr:hypothetical protein JTE90_003961 [Oedothorax gibbosus]
MEYLETSLAPNYLKYFPAIAPHPSRHLQIIRPSLGQRPPLHTRVTRSAPRGRLERRPLGLSEFYSSEFTVEVERLDMELLK